MKIDTGVAIVILAVLVFYLRLIILQRERAKQMRKPKRMAQNASKSTVRNMNQSAEIKNTSSPQGRMNILSSNRRDWWIAGSGVIAIIIGVLLYLEILPYSTAQQFWWIPTALGIVAFSWGFRL